MGKKYQDKLDNFGGYSSKHGKQHADSYLDSLEDDISDLSEEDEEVYFDEYYEIEAEENDHPLRCQKCNTEHSPETDCVAAESDVDVLEETDGRGESYQIVDIESSESTPDVLSDWEDLE